ncbi:undecaprenyldiphospho-muramoylpentapeptide beta-N-acetylglucosaminyltransferase [Robertkochia aurantiaca]|uniref:undecaprenyldiphospho-muramoylpentapeptide beta-N-acetylglucosaminyltransferase n=1 Tax=Robertkochia aurantiaca TaxID=2873700 RepID=UPI001CCE3348
MGKYRFILSGGGTGGHIYPAVAIADELKRRHPDADFLFVGASDRMEMEKVPQAGYEIKGLWISGIQRKLSLKNLLFPLKLLSSLIKSRRILRSFKPDLVVGTGGFASGPLLRAATDLGIPAVIQEQNSFAGITNKWLAPQVDRIFTAYEGLEKVFPKEKIILTGNPVRSGFSALEKKKQEALKHFGLSADKPVLFVMGGSLGAREINKLIASRLDLFRSLDVQVLWQCGKLYYDQYRRHENEAVKVLDFITDMELAYAAADIIVSRAGAGSVSELAIVGKPVIFIPSPNVAEDHQTKNALAVVEKQAALMLSEGEMHDKFDDLFEELLEDQEKRKTLGERFKALALPDATQKIVDEIERLLHKKSNE